MKKNQLPWRQFLYVMEIATLLGTSAFIPNAVALAEVNVDRACYGNEDSRSCSQHQLRCREETIFITQAFRGFKQDKDKCYVQRPSCMNEEKCCRNHTDQDCAEEYTQEAFTALARGCWNQRSCDFIVPHAATFSCSSAYEYVSGYSELQYLCLPDWAIIDFKGGRVKIASNLVLRYRSSDDPGDYVCLVEADDCSSRTVDGVLYRTNTSFSFGFCTTLSVGEGSDLSCSKGSAQYKLYQHSTPFRVLLDVNKNNDATEAWALLHGDTSGTLRVTCKPQDYMNSFPECSPATAPPTSPEKTTPATDIRTTVSSATPDTTSAADVQSLSTSSVTSVSSADVSGENMPQSSDSSSNTAGIVGGVVGAVLVVLVVVALVVTLVFLNSRGTQGKTAPKIVTWFRGGNSSNHSHGNSPAVETSDSGRAVLHITPAQPTSLPAYDNSMAAIADEAGVRVDPGSDYSHLRQKPTSSTARDVTYGHLADSNDVTDYGYDHVTKGKPTVRSGDVINNVYDTAGPATGVPSDEDFYNVAGAAKNWPDVINNVYNTPSPATEASSDGDYYNVTGLPETGRDVIDNVYDTPKPAAAPGLVETEACVVTGVDAGSPY